MNLDERNRQIRRHRANGWSYPEISQRFKVSAERARQVCEQTQTRQDIYNSIEAAYRDKVIKKADYYWIKAEIERLSNPNRQKQLVIERQYLIRYLVDNLGFSFFQTAKLLKRHHTSISNLYYNRKREYAN